ncbi:MAG: hypothetical protein U0U67_12275 [Chitinophagales bacterium]
MEEQEIQKKSMSRAAYAYSETESIPNLKNLKNDFQIITDTNFKAVNFISDLEIFNKKLARIKDAEAIHKMNQGQQLIWIINNTNDTIELKAQDFSLLCLLQAKTKNGLWKNIEYWRFSDCGNSYYSYSVLPKTANSIISNFHNEGDFETLLRFQIAGKYKFYYSNEFSGRIYKSRFVADTSAYYEQYGHRYKIPHENFDSIYKNTREY